MSVWPSLHQQSIVISQSVAWKLQFLCACHNIDRWESSKKNVWPHWYWYILNLKYKDVCMNAKVINHLQCHRQKRLHHLCISHLYHIMNFEVDHCLFILLCQGWRYLYKMMYLDDFSEREIMWQTEYIFPKDNFINYIYIKKTIKRGKFVFYLQFYCIVALLLTLWVKCRVLGSLHSGACHKIVCFYR